MTLSNPPKSIVDAFVITITVSFGIDVSNNDLDTNVDVAVNTLFNITNAYPSNVADTSSAATKATATIIMHTAPMTASDFF